MNSELLVHVDVNDVDLGDVARNIAHTLDHLVLHREAMVLLFNPAHTHFLMQKRVPDKQWGNKWTLSATGHVNRGDITNADSAGYVTTGRREASEEIGVEAINLQLVTTQEIKTEKNWAMAGILVGEYVGEPHANPAEVAEIRPFTQQTITEIQKDLTPGALRCLVLLGILASPESSL